MSDIHMINNEWNTHHFAVGGSFAGGAYAFLICNLVGLVALPTLAAVFVAVMLGAGAGAVIAGGIAAVRNYLVDHTSPNF